MINLIRNQFAALDTIELTITGKQLIKVAEKCGYIDLHTELCESYNERTKTHGAEDAKRRGFQFVSHYLGNVFNPAA